jgi:hypothetical protein
VTYFTEPVAEQSYRLLASPSAHTLSRLISVWKVPDARRQIFQELTWSQSQRGRSLYAKFFTREPFQLLLFLLEYCSITSPTRRRQYGLWRIQLWT